MNSHLSKSIAPEVLNETIKSLVKNIKIYSAGILDKDMTPWIFLYGLSDL